MSENSIRMNNLTKEQLDNDFHRVFIGANKDKELYKMCRLCEEWCGDEHDYQECINKPCFTFYRCYKFLNYYNSWKQ